jgi:polysaccharide biosynthesis transport protein
MDEPTKIRLYDSMPRAIEPVRPIPFKAVEVEDASPDLFEYWRIVRKRKATILTVLFIVFTIALVGTLKQKPVFRARALVEIQKENPDVPTLQELFQVETISDAYLETQYKILKSENVARRVIDELGIDQLPEFKPAARSWFSGAKPEPPPAAATDLNGDTGKDPDAYSDVLKKFDDRLSVDPVKRSRLVELSFESTDPALAARVVNSLASNYIEENLEARWQASEKASDWLSQQLMRMKAKLEKSEDELQKYSRETGLLFLATEKGTTENIVDQRLHDLQEELTKAQADRYQKESLYRLVQEGDFAALPGVFDDKLLQDLSERLADLKRQRSQLSTTFNPDYPRVKEIQSQIDDAEANLTQDRERATRMITGEYRAAVSREDMLTAAFGDQQKAENDVAEKSVQYNILKRETDTNKQLYEGLLQKLKETGVSTSMRATNIRIVDPAQAPRKPVRPRVFLNLSLGLLVGLCLGTAMAFAQEHLDNTIKSPEDVERFLRLPALASIPAVDSGEYHGIHSLYERAKILSTEGQAAAALAPVWNKIETNGNHSALLEAFHGLRTSVLLSTAEAPPRTLLVSSAQPGEGKTTVAANLAISLAQLGDPVLLIDADLRRPSLHNFFGVTAPHGLVGFLTGHEHWKDLVCHLAPVGLDVLFCGPIPPNPADLLSSEYMRTLIRDASKTYKFVVIDSPPLLNVADSRILATLVDGVLLVVVGGVTPRDLAQRAQASARDVGAHILGAAINFADLSSGHYYYSPYVTKEE